MIEAILRVQDDPLRNERANFGVQQYAWHNDVLKINEIFSYAFVMYVI